MVFTLLNGYNSGTQNLTMWNNTQKKVKVCHFYIYIYIKILFEKNIGKMVTIISNTNCKSAVVQFHKLSATFPVEFYQFLPVFDFLTLTDQEQVLKTHFLPLDAPIRKKSHGVRSRFEGGP